MPSSPPLATTSTSQNQSQALASTSYSPPQPQIPTLSRLQFCLELSQCLADFVVQLLPTPEELAVKEDVRKLLERLIRTLKPESRLLSFGSTANGFSLRNSDMDLCCLTDDKDRPDASQLVQMTGELLERETKFQVKPLPHARIPIVKLSLAPSPGLPFGIACDIGFENRLALENTRLLMSYAAIDPIRVRTIVLFLKVWSKRRKINSPYKGTLSSYGYVLLVIYFLVHVKNPPVLPNLQQIPPMRPISYEDTHLNGRDIWFFDDIDMLRQRWVSRNEESVAELLIDFFRYFSKDFTYNTGVASIRAGLLMKEDKGWLESETRNGRYVDLAQERNRLCIEDPFETDFNVARSVTREGLYVIRGEFMRAHRLLLQRNEKVLVTIAQLCDERPDNIRPPDPTPLFTGPNQLPSIPAQVPYPVGSGSQSLREKEGAGARDRLSPPQSFFEKKRSAGAEDKQVGNETKEVDENGANSLETTGSSSDPQPDPSQVVVGSLPPEHMAPKRAKWTSPPPPNADVSDLKLFENQFEYGLEIATQPSRARESCSCNPSSSRYATSEISEGQSDIETNPDEDSYSDIGFADSRSVVSFNGLEPSRQFPSSHSTGTRTPPLQIMQNLRHHLNNVGRSASPPINEHRLPPRHQFHRPPRLLQASRSNPQNFDRAVSDGEPDRVEPNSHRLSRESLLPPLSASVPHDRGLHPVPTQRQRSHRNQNNSSNSYRPPPRIQARSGSFHQQTAYPIHSIVPTATLTGYNIYHPFLAPTIPATQSTSFYQQNTFANDQQRHLGIDTNSLSPHSSGSGYYSTQSSPLQLHPGSEGSPTTAPAMLQAVTAARSAFTAASPTVTGQFDILSVNPTRPITMRQVSPVTPHRPLPVRRSEASRSPQSAATEHAVRLPEPMDATTSNLAGLRLRSSSASGTPNPYKTSRQNRD